MCVCLIRRARDALASIRTVPGGRRRRPLFPGRPRSALLQEEIQVHTEVRGALRLVQLGRLCQSAAPARVSRRLCILERRDRRRAGRGGVDLAKCKIVIQNPHQAPGVRHGRQDDFHREFDAGRRCGVPGVQAQRKPLA